LASATILAGDCMTADGLATAVMILGPEEAKKL
jgi:thiamine biosynthesis lipoprotein ApbE